MAAEKQRPGRGPEQAAGRGGGRRGPRRDRVRVAKRASPGSAPGTLVADPAAEPTHVSALLYGPDGLEELTGCAPGDVGSLRGRAPVLWVDVDGLADVAAIQAVGDAFDLHPLAQEDVINVHQRPKAEEYDQYLFIVARMLVPGRGPETEQVALFVGDGYVVTFQERRGDCFDPVRERLRNGRRILELGADYLAYALIDAVLDGYFPALEAIGERVEALEDAVIARPAPEQVDDLHQLKRELLALRRAIWPAREMVNALIRDESPHLSANTRLYLRDCYDHAIQLMDIIETYREIAAGLLDVYLSSLSARMNEIMKVLTIIATIFIPLSFVASVYGMNFDTSSPWNMPELEWRFGYPVVLLGMAAIAGGLLLYFWRKGWMGGQRRHDSMNR